MSTVKRLFRKSEQATNQAAQETAKVSDRAAGLRMVTSALIEKADQVLVKRENILIYDLCFLIARYASYTKLQADTRFFRSFIMKNPETKLDTYEANELIFLSKLTSDNFLKVSDKLDRYLQDTDNQNTKTYKQLSAYVNRFQSETVNQVLARELVRLMKDYMTAKKFYSYCFENASFEFSIIQQPHLALACSLESNQLAHEKIHSLTPSGIEKLKSAVADALDQLSLCKNVIQEDAFDNIAHNRELEILSGQLSIWKMVTDYSGYLIGKPAIPNALEYVPDEVGSVTNFMPLDNARAHSRTDFSSLSQYAASPRESIPGVVETPEESVVLPANIAEEKQAEAQGDANYALFRTALQKRIAEYEAKVKHRWSFCGLRTQSQLRKEQIENLRNDLAAVDADLSISDKMRALTEKTQARITLIKRDHVGSSCFFKRFVTKSNLAEACERALLDVGYNKLYN